MGIRVRNCFFFVFFCLFSSDFFVSFFAHLKKKKNHEKNYSAAASLVDEIVWVKSTVNRRLAKSHGYYLQHAKEVCLVGVKRGDGGGGRGGESSATAAAATAALGSPAAAAAAARLSSGSALYPAEGVGSDIIFSERRGQSQKPEEIYQLVEAVCPGGSFLEIFGRKNNLRDFWVTVGNEVTGTGPPREDATVIAAGGRIPGAVYGAAGR